ncbi:MAG TPA: hypothetical protein VMG10_16875 [Gemmataceae bacterium]|nr:hypothetical protein [Gemmataceae bacterium]
MATTAAVRALPERALELLRRTGNPFRNYFARNPDDEVCALYHVPELFSRERELLLSVVDLYRYAPTTHSEVVPVLGSKGSGKTHLLHSIKHGPEGAWQLLVTPGTYQRDTDFLEYLLFQLIDTLLGGGKQKNTRPLEYIGEQLVRNLLRDALLQLSAAERLDLFPAPGLGRWARRLGLGGSQAQERTQWLIDCLTRPCPLPFQAGGVLRACGEAGIETAKAFELVCAHILRTEKHDTAGLMRRHILDGLARAVLMNDESDLASFLTYGFAELDFHVRPTRQDLVLALFKSIMQVLQELRIPVVVAFDQLEDLLLARRSDDGHRTAESFFAGIVQSMHQLDGISFLIFAERGLWNRFVPSLDGYIQDRLNNPIHLPNHGTLQTLRLEAPPLDLVRRIVEARLRPALEKLPDCADLSPLFPFTAEQIALVARTEPTLRDMLQQLRHQFDHVVYSSAPLAEPGARAAETTPSPLDDSPAVELPVEEVVADIPPEVKSVVVVETPVVAPEPSSAFGSSTPSFEKLGDLWDQELRAARRKLEPEGALTGATRELQSGLGALLQLCHEHGVKVGPWRLHHVVGEWTFGDHPTYGVMTIAHWVCKDGQPWKVGIGLFLGRGPAKPRDLGTKLSALEVEPSVIDHLILLRPEDDLALSGKSKTLWQESERRGRHTRLEPVALDGFAALSALPRFVASLTESLPDGQPLPNLADLLQEKCEKLLEQVCMPVQG